jgi:predicted ATP-dependent Lon-type protease
MQLKFFGLAAVALAPLLSSCSPKTRQPIEEQEIVLRIGTEALVCRVKNIAGELNLGFHYGTSDQPFGKIATFRLIGDQYEIILYNPERRTDYFLSLYSDSQDERIRAAAKRTFVRMKSTLSQPDKRCDSSR